MQKSWCIKCTGTTLLTLCIMVHMALGQTGNITGRVVERSTREPMHFATIALYQEKDTVTVFKAATTNQDGIFDFKSIPEGKYYLVVSFIGFETQQTPVFTHQKRTDVGTIRIQTSDILLNDVKVTGEKSTLINSIDKKIYNVEEDLMSETGSASDILQNIPSVSVDINGGISLRGTANITFLVNGKPSGMMRRNAATALQQMPANSIERIEVITNPSAKYRPDGTGGIINIVLKKEVRQGINGQITANIGNEKRYNTNLTLNYGTTKLNLFANYGLRHSAGTIIYADERIYKDSTSGQMRRKYNEAGKSTTRVFAHTANAGMQYHLNDYNSFELSGTYFLQNSWHKGLYDIITHDPENQLMEKFTSNQMNDEYESEGEASGTFEHSFKNNEDHTLSIEATYSRYGEKEDKAYHETYSLPAVESSVEKILIQKSGGQAELKAEYNLPLDEDIEFQAGYVGEFIHDDIRYTNNLNPNRFLFHQNTHALYAIYGQSIENFSFEAGLRAEQTLVNSQRIVPADPVIPNNYFKLYPTLHVKYEPSDNKEIGLSYSKRINRPEADELNPNPEFNDPRNAEGGNPYLKPEQIHAVELSYESTGEKITLTPTLYYRYKYDAFTTIKKPMGDSVILSTVENLQNQQSAGLEVILSGEITRRLDADLSTNLFYNQINAVNLGYLDKRSVFSETVKLHTFYRITQATLFQLNAFYYSPQITPQGQRNQFFYMNAGLKQEIFKKRAALTLTVSDILHSYRTTRTIERPDLSQITKIYRRQPVVYFGITWQFNNQDNDQDKGFEFEGNGLKK